MSSAGPIRLRFFEGQGSASSFVPESAEAIDSLSSNDSGVDECGLGTPFSCPALLSLVRLAISLCEVAEFWRLLVEPARGAATGPDCHN